MTVATTTLLALLLAQTSAAPPSLPQPSSAPPPATRRHAAQPPFGEPPAPARPRTGGARRLEPFVLQALFAADPPVDALRQAAAALALAEPERAHSMLIRARAAGWLPEIRARAERRFGRSESVDLGGTGPATPVGIDSDNALYYELRLTWDLSRLLFNPDEIAAQLQALRAADARREIESLVIRLYFERRRLKAELATADAGTTSSDMKLELRIAEVEAELDALTGGAFTRLRRS
jgi:hypothetical protein